MKVHIQKYFTDRICDQRSLDTAGLEDLFRSLSCAFDITLLILTF